MQAPDITKTPTLYVVPYAHLDTQWRWEFPQVISEYLLKTMRVNFDYMDKYPHYVFNWTGSNRYRLMKEYYPDDYARLKGYVAKGQWFPAGSSVEEGDVNLPTAEGIFRQVLYGNTYYRHEFGKASNEYMLPDCFGFPASLPAILAHAGVKGFSTQKLNSQWQPAPRIGGANSPEQTPEGIPFNVGVWVGPDGSRLVSALNPSDYNHNVNTDLTRNDAPITFPTISQTELDALTSRQKRSLQRIRNQKEPNWPERIGLNGKVTGLFADYEYVGTGDIGGAAEETSIKLLEAIVQKEQISLPALPDFVKAPPMPPVRVGMGPVHVVVSAADQMFNDIKPDETERMPTYQGDLELINHSAGSLTSQAYHKRWVAKNELLADAAEKASLAAAWMGAQPYPQKRLNDAWTLALGGHFHDTAAGTATPRSYEFAWNDDVLTANQFAGVFTSATESVSSALDTSGPGTPLVLFNALNIAREDVVEVALPSSMQSSGTMHVVSSTGEQIPAQTADGKVLFVAKLPSVGYAVYHLVPGAASRTSDELKVTSSSLENSRYRVQLNSDGDVASIFDKSLKKELLAAPIRLALSHDTPQQWPAWNMDFDQEQAAPRAYVSGPAKIRVKENGPVRVSIEVVRESEGSRYAQTISLAAGDSGNRVEFANVIDWRGKEENLKASFPLTASNPNATYNEDVGTLQRPNAMERQFEVLSHRWIDLTDKSGSYGVTLLTDDKNGSDKRNDNTIRLTLLRSPGISAKGASYTDQANQDWGHHEFTFGLAGHANGWREAQTDWQAYRLNDPVRAFYTASHPGSLGKQFSLLHLDNSRIRVLALKKAEDSDELVLRMVELDGKSAPGVHVRFAAGINSAREINAQEQPLGEATVTGGELVTSFGGYQPKTFALRLTTPPATVSAIASKPVPLPYDLATATNDDSETKGGGFDGKGDAYPAEMLPEQLSYDGVEFQLTRAATGTPNAVAANGQSVALPVGDFNRVYILAAGDGDQQAQFHIGGKAVTLNVENWGGFIGQWDTRLWKGTPESWAISAHHAVWPPANLDQSEAERPSPHFPEDYLGLREGFIKPASVAWYASHHHTAAGLNDPYAYSYLFAYTLDLPPGVRQLTLPNNSKVRILAVSVAHNGPTVAPAQPLFDTLQHTLEPKTSTK
ncbi:alpha-mannosidase [Granulicella sp. WH15]|nr:alpha-mannosidase [Granulicella sp. WH15]